MQVGVTNHIGNVMERGSVYLRECSTMGIGEQSGTPAGMGKRRGTPVITRKGNVQRAVGRITGGIKC